MASEFLFLIAHLQSFEATKYECTIMWEIQWLMILMVFRVTIKYGNMIISTTSCNMKTMATRLYRPPIPGPLGSLYIQDLRFHCICDILVNQLETASEH